MGGLALLWAQVPDEQGQKNFRSMTVSSKTLFNRYVQAEGDYRSGFDTLEMELRVYLVASSPLVCPEGEEVH